MLMERLKKKKKKPQKKITLTPCPVWVHSLVEAPGGYNHSSKYTFPCLNTPASDHQLPGLGDIFE